MRQIALEFGSFTIHWYGVFVAAGFLAGLMTATKRALRLGISGETIADLGMWIIVGAIAGARTLYVVSYWEESFQGQSWFELVKIWEGGLVFYGGLFGASFACILFCALRKVPLWDAADIMAPSIALGHCLGRIGCLMNGCCFGRECELPWAIHFPEEHFTAGMAVHPTQIYEASLNLVLYLGLAWLFRHRRFPGQVFTVYLLAYAVLRSSVEMFRGDYGQYYAGFVTPAHLVSGVILAAGIVLVVVLPRRHRTAPKSGKAASG